MIFDFIKKTKKPDPQYTRTEGALYQERKEKYLRALHICKKLFKFMAIISTCVLVSCFSYVIYVYSSLPDVASLNMYAPNETTKILSSDGVVLAQLHKEENRETVPLSEISSYIKKAVVAVEDKRFYSHHGVDWFGIMRAVVKDILSGSPTQGASTLTQQLVKNVFLHRGKTIKRKVSEIILSAQIERRYTKDEILEMYLNEVYWGHNAYGIESAARIYFGKSSRMLSLAESSMLVGLLRGPEIYSPYKNFKEASFRKTIILKKLLQLGAINKNEYNIALGEEIVLKGTIRSQYKAPYFVSHVIETLIKNYGKSAVYMSGLTVHTSLDYKSQLVAERVVEDVIKMGEEREAAFSEAAFLAVDPRSGNVIAMVGGRDYSRSQFNRTIHARRQPGSAFKPITFLVALNNGYKPGSIISDRPVVYKSPTGLYRPTNYHHNYLGDITLRKALEISQNVPAIKLIKQYGPKKIISVAKKLGIDSPLAPYLPLTLGASDVTMLEMAKVYSVLASGGQSVPIRAITKVVNRDNIDLLMGSSNPTRLYKRSVVAMLVDMMKGVVERGTGRGARLRDRPSAGKTGTTSDYRDAWYVGFVPQMVGVAWVGNDNNVPMNKVTGGYYPAIMWRKYMETVLKDIPPQNFIRPRGSVYHTICKSSKQIAGLMCPPALKQKMYFMKDNVPGRECSVHQEAIPSISIIEISEQVIIEENSSKNQKT